MILVKKGAALCGHGGVLYLSETKGKAATRAKNRYNTNNYDSLRIVVPKGQKATVKAAADEAGESINQYTQGALLARMGLSEWPQDGPAEE